MIRRASDHRPDIAIDFGYVLLAPVLVLAAFLRFWRIDSMFHFMGDEGRESMAEWNLIHGKLPLLGPSLSIGRTLHLGPFFYYLEAIPIWLSNGSPVGPTILVGLFGVATPIVLFLYLRRCCGSVPAAAAALVMAASFLMVEYSRRPWNPTVTPFFTLMFLWSLVSWKRGNPAWLLVTSASLACLLQLQPVNLFLVPVAVIFVIWARPGRPSAAVICGAVIAFVVISSPLLIYDGGHNLSNLRGWLAVLTHGKSNAPPRNASSLKLLFNLFYRAFGLPIVALTAVITVAVVLAGLLRSLFDGPDGETVWETRLAIILLIVAAIGLEVYRKQVFEQYMVCLFVVPFILLAALLWLLGKHPVGAVAGVVLVAALVGVGARESWTYSFVTPKVTVADASITHNDLQRDDTYGHVMKVDRILVSWANGRQFQIQMASYLNYPAAYEYVLRRDGHTPSGKAKLTFLLVEPAGWPKHDWPQADRRLAAKATRSKTIGLTKLYEVP